MNFQEAMESDDDDVINKKKIKARMAETSEKLTSVFAMMEPTDDFDFLIADTNACFIIGIMIIARAAQAHGGERLPTEKILMIAACLAADTAIKIGHMVGVPD